MSTLDINEILKYLPHRYPFLLVDRVVEMEEGKRIVALKNVTMNEPFFPGDARRTFCRSNGAGSGRAFL